MEQNEEQYIKGFNRGYTITKYLPDLSEAILNNIGSANDFIDGFTSGKKEYELEQSNLRIDDMDQIRIKSKGQQKGNDREI